MCAYNVRRSKQVDHEPARGPERTINLIREAGVWALALAVAYGVFLLARRFLF